MKLNVMFLSLILFASIFAVGGVLAQESDITADESVVESADVVSSEDIEIIEEEEIENELPEEEEALEEIDKESEEKEIFSITHVTIGEGFILSEDELNAAFFRGMWTVRRFIEKNGDSEDIEKKEIKAKRTGWITLGGANNKEKFKLEIVDFNDEGISFDLKSQDGSVAGSLDIVPKRYEQITLWFGDLVIDSGDYSGSWSVTATAKTKIIKPKIKKPSAWNIFAGSKRKEAQLKEKVQEKLFRSEGLGDIEEGIKKIRINKEERSRLRTEEKTKFELKTEREIIEKELRQEIRERREKLESRVRNIITAEMG